MSTLNQSITTMDRNDTTDDSGRNLMYQKIDETRIGEKANVTQHYSCIENSNNEDHPEASHCSILALDAVKKMLVFIRAKFYSKVIQGLGLALNLPH